MRGKITWAYWDEIEGCAAIAKATPYGEFTAETMVHPEDKDIANS